MKKRSFKELMQAGSKLVYTEHPWRRQTSWLFAKIVRTKIVDPYEKNQRYLNNYKPSHYTTPYLAGKDAPEPAFIDNN